jgi:hypothetical protein
LSRGSFSSAQWRKAIADVNAATATWYSSDLACEDARIIAVLAPHDGGAIKHIGYFLVAPPNSNSAGAEIKR